MGLLIGLGAFLACLAAGAILLGLGHVIIGFAVLLASVPCAIVAWIKWNDRSYG
jgi:predicted permease